MNIERLVVAAAFAALAHLGGAGSAQAEYSVPMEESTREIVSEFRGPEYPLPPELGDPSEYARIHDVLPMLLDTHDFDSPEGFLEFLTEAFGYPSQDRLVCPVDLDGQKFRVAGGKFRIAGGELPVSPVDLSDSDGDGKPGPFWTLEPSPLVVQIEHGPPLHLVILDDFEFSLLGEISGFPSGGVASGQGPHGHLVTYHSLLSMGADLATLPQQYTRVEEAGPFSQSPIGWSQTNVALHSGAFATVTMIDVDFDEPLIHAADAVAFANNAFGGAPGVVFNASWNLVPCSLAEAYDETGFEFQSFGHFLWHRATAEVDDPRLNAMFDAYRAIYGEEADVEEAGVDVRQRELDLFEFRVLLAANERVASAIASLFDTSNPWFASAGNLSLGFALPPASFANVTAVGACHLTRAHPGETLQLARASWSNLGATNILGAYFRGDLGHDPGAAPYAGTSFASPIAAIAHAAGTSNRLIDCTP